MTVSEWADERRVLSREDSAEPGQWRTSRAEYQRGIMDAVTDADVEELVVLKATQVGWTAILANVVGYHIDLDPCPMLMLQPTVDTAKAWSKERLAPMLRDTPALAGKVKDPRSRDSNNTIQHKEFDGGHLTAVGANAPSGLAMRPIRVLLCDETDRYPISAGSEGDPQKLASKRQTTFWNRKTLKGSAPTIKRMSPIERDYERSDKRRFHVPCPHCRETQILVWSQVKWDKTKNDRGETIEHHPDTAHYQCEQCGELWTDAERWEAISKGKWKATAPFSGVAGFHLPQWYSPWVQLSEIVTEFLDARGRPELLQVWTNTVAAETWEEAGESVDSHTLKSHVGDYEPYALPEGVLFATAGVDVQKDRIEVELIGWGEDDESWGILHEIIDGDPAKLDAWKDLEEIIFDRYWTEGGRLVKVKATCVDYGGHHGAQVGQFANKHWKRNVHAVKGADGPRLIWPERQTRGKHTSRLRVVGVDAAKESWYGRFAIDEPGPGYCHWSPEYDDDYFEQVTVEEAVTKYKNGRPYRVWRCPPGKRNEALDMRVYALCARMSLRPREMLPSKVVAETVEAREHVATIEAQAQDGRRRRRIRSKGIRR